MTAFVIFFEKDQSGKVSRFDIKQENRGLNIKKDELGGSTKSDK